jgi:hypothetical protein
MLHWQMFVSSMTGNPSTAELKRTLEVFVLSESWGSHSTADKESSLLEYDTAYIGTYTAVL